LSLAYLDANVFVYAFLKPKRKLQPHEVSIKEAAKKIVARISAGEEVVSSVVHFSEVCNILEEYLPFDEALALEKGLLLRENIRVHEVTQDDYINALSIAEQQHQIGLNDALAYVLIKKMDIKKIYSFDKHFDCFADLKRITS
jgi:predicted nucleic acid-binding protein